MKRNNSIQTNNPLFKIEEESCNWMVGEIRLKYEEYKKPNIKVHSPEDAFMVVLNSVDIDSLRIQEHFYALYFDVATNLLGFKTINTGSLTTCTVNVRLFLSIALILNATYAIVLHNHPSGNCTPSTSDINLTKMLIDASKNFDLQIYDHIIFSPDKYTSMQHDGYYHFDLRGEYRRSENHKIDDRWSSSRRIAHLKKKLSQLT